MPEPILRELAGKQSPVNIGRDDTAYPLARILDVIDRLQLSVVPSAKDLAAALGDPLPTVRYWGALGALRAPKSIAAELTPLLKDANASVRLAAAFAIARHGTPDTAWPVLAAGLAPS